jgi:hypothetical protein
VLFRSVENNQPLDSLFHTKHRDEFNRIIQELRGKSFRIQTQYLERVFELIKRNDDDLILNHIQQNERSSYEWCVRFNVPMYPQRRRLIEERQTDQPVSFPQ